MLLFKKDIKYSLDGKTTEEHIFRSGEKYSLDFVLTKFGQGSIDCFIANGVIEIQEAPLVEIQVDTQDNIQTQVFEIMYKTTQSIQDKDGNEIEVGSQFTENELKEIISQDKRQSKKKIKELLEEEKIMEVKIIK